MAFSRGARIEESYNTGGAHQTHPHISLQSKIKHTRPRMIVLGLVLLQGVFRPLGPICLQNSPHAAAFPHHASTRRSATRIRSLMIDPMDAIDAFSTLVAAASPDPDQAGSVASTLAGQSPDPALGAAAGYLTSSDVAMAADIAAAPESAPTETAATAVASASQAARSDSSTASIIEDAPVAAAVGVILIGGAAVFVLGSALEGLVGLASAVGSRLVEVRLTSRPLALVLMRQLARSQPRQRRCGGTR